MKQRDPYCTSTLEDPAEFTRQAPGGVFLVIHGPDRGEQVVLSRQPVVFGAGRDCDLVLADPAVSRRHASASLERGQVIVRDLGSTNGSFTHGARFKEIALGLGAELRLGQTVLKLVPQEEAVEPDEVAEDRFGDLLGRDQQMRRLFGLLRDVAQSDTSVLIEGETGTGKELIAEQLHRRSSRAAGPLVVFDCGAVPPRLIESALFGHVKGAFTGAVADHRGAFAEAHGGTLFLDEIGELRLDLQPALLRALDRRTVQPVGARASQKVDVRIIAATNRDLRDLVARRQFREDLYYRLAVLRLHLPPLRERGQDIDLLTEHFIQRFAERPLRLLPEDQQRLRRHDWPGNVRELRNVIERACVLSQGETLNVDEALGGATEDRVSVRSDLPFKEAKEQLVEQFEREYFADLLKRHRINLSAAAREAQIDRKHLRALLRKHGLSIGEKMADSA